MPRTWARSIMSGEKVYVAGESQPVESFTGGLLSEKI